MKRWVGWSVLSAVMVSGKLGCVLLKLDGLRGFPKGRCVNASLHNGMGPGKTAGSVTKDFGYFS